MQHVGMCLCAKRLLKQALLLYKFLAAILVSKNFINWLWY
jgi:hypothetical protein